MKRTPLRRRSKKLESKMREYIKLRKAYLEAHPFCQAELILRGIDEQKYLEGRWLVDLASNGTLAPIPASVDIHHCKGRGQYLLDTSTWLAVSRKNHEWIHNNPTEAEFYGLLKRRNGESRINPFAP